MTYFHDNYPATQLPLNVIATNEKITIRIVIVTPRSGVLGWSLMAKVFQ